MPAEADLEAWHQLAFYTLAHGDPAFIHQHAVDAFAAQTATAETKPITVVFAVVGLYLHIEQRWSGRAVQRAHMRLARSKREWPRLPLPDDRGVLTAHDVLAATEGPERDAMIERWCASVWMAWAPTAFPVVLTLTAELPGPPIDQTFDRR